MILVRLLDHIGGDVANHESRAQILAVPDDRLHLHEVHHADKSRLAADGQLDHSRDCREVVLDHLHTVVEVGAGAVHLVNEAHAGHTVLVGLTPDGLGLRLDARDAVEAADRTVEHAQRTLNFKREVDVTRRVNDVDPVILPVARGRRRGDGDATLLLLDHPVHRRATIVHLADLARLARVEQDALRRGGLPRVNVRADADVAVVLDRYGAPTRRGERRLRARRRHAAAAHARRRRVQP
mmetsp:Transcript_22678/g.52584  ORF Transcript_22678/g.52584 Transcript_22678/m.52584 type:complete len:239 (+) Transcript_22678:979-1695(+)